MTRYAILPFTDPLLKQRAGDFRTDSRHPDLAQLLAMLPHLATIMKQHQLVGLALPQVGWSVRAFLYDPWAHGYPRLFLNPSWLAARTQSPDGGKELSREGCLSVRQCKTKLPVERWRFVKAEALEIQLHRKPKPRPFASELHGWEARVWQHECDHLDGVLLGGNPIPEDEDHRVWETGKARDE